MSVSSLDYMFHSYFHSLKIVKDTLFVDNQWNITSVPSEKTVDLIDCIAAIGTVIIFHQDKYLGFELIANSEHKKNCSNLKAKIIYNPKNMAYIVDSETKDILFSYGYHVIINCLTEMCVSQVNEKISVCDKIIIITDNLIEKIHDMLLRTKKEVAQMVIKENELKLFVDPNNNITEINDSNDSLGIELWMDSDEKWNEIKFKVATYIGNKK
jgi:hypothetical protein